MPVFSAKTSTLERLSAARAMWTARELEKKSLQVSMFSERVAGSFLFSTMSSPTKRSSRAKARTSQLVLPVRTSKQQLRSTSWGVGWFMFFALKVASSLFFFLQTLRVSQEHPRHPPSHLVHQDSAHRKTVRGRATSRFAALTGTGRVIFCQRMPDSPSRFPDRIPDRFPDRFSSRFPSQFSSRFPSLQSHVGHVSHPSFEIVKMFNKARFPPLCLLSCVGVGCMWVRRNDFPRSRSNALEPWLHRNMIVVRTKFFL